MRVPNDLALSAAAAAAEVPNKKGGLGELWALKHAAPAVAHPWHTEQRVAALKVDAALFLKEPGNIPGSTQGEREKEGDHNMN